MKDIKEYINNKPITQLSSGKILNDFYEFINYNNITNINENTYDFYIESVFNRLYPFLLDDSYYTYNRYQKDLYLFETLNHSWDSQKLVNELNKISNIKKVNYVNPKHKITQFEIIYNNYEEINKLLNNDKFWSLIRLYNYYIKTVVEDNNSIILEPYKPEDITNKIYNDLNGIIYHITTKQKYISSIKNKELAPKWKGEWDKLKNKPFNIWRDGRIFFIGDNDEKKVRQQLTSIKNTSSKLRNEEYIILKINLNKYKNKLRFRIDSSAYGYESYFTEEPIPDFCITPINLDTWEEIDKKSL